MGGMFYNCSSLKELNISNFNTDNVKDMSCMFKGCSKQFQNKIKVQYKNIKKEAFDKYEKYKHNCVKH
jgi:surface protein